MGVYDFVTPHGRAARFHVREDTSDWNTVNSCTGTNDEYHIPEGSTGWALDVGAHIGACIVTLLIDNPGLQGVAIEALPENVELLRMNAAENRVDDRLTILHGGATDDSGKTVRVGYGEFADPTGVHEYIGNGWAPEGSRFVEVPGVSLEDVIHISAEEIEWMKIDCEGCELPFLSSPSISWVRHIEGEVHPQAGGQVMLDLLSATHDVTFPGWEANPDFGPFVANLR